MTLSSLLVSADEASVQVLRQVMEELGMRVEICADPARAAMRQAQDRFDLIVLDCEKSADVIGLLHEIRSSPMNDAVLTVVVAGAQEGIREMFSSGINFVLYGPLSYERALSSLRAAQTALHRDKRRKARTPVHTHATIDYAGIEQQRATLVDLAEEGMAVNFGKRLPPTCKVYFQFQLPGETATVRLSGQVMWQDWNGRAGVQFVDVPQSSRRILSKWLQMNLAEAPARELAAGPVEVQHSIRPTKVSTKDVVAQDCRVENSPQNASPRIQKAETVHSEDKRQANTRDQEGAARLRSETDHRRQIRYACRLGAEVYQQGSAVRNYCHLSDLSPGGCYLEMPLAFAAGTAVEIIVRTQEMKLRLSGEVKASHPGYGMGISFKLNTKSERDGVQQLIDFAAAAAEASS
ncbi:MAG: PilZ domain-containing protein [Candidatus Sulfotelmatobacter sp.]